MSLPDNSTDMESDNLIKRYEKHSKALGYTCLADQLCIPALFNYVHQSKSVDKGESTNYDQNINNDVLWQENAEHVEKEYFMRDGMKLVKRKKQK